MALIVGTDFSDEIQAPDTGAEIRGLGGDDILRGGAGLDTLAGNVGNDIIFVGASPETSSGSDFVQGGQGQDTIVGALFGFGNNILNGNKGNDLVFASTNGGDTVFGGQANDTLYSGIAGSNVMQGDLGDDVLFAGTAGDRLLGGDGSDILVGGKGSDNLFGNEGSDSFRFFSQGPAGPFAFLTPEQNIRTEGGFGGGDTIFDFGSGDGIAISLLDRNATVSVSDNAAGAAVITIAGSASNGQSAAQTITVAGTNTAALLSPGSQILSVNGVFITSASPGVVNTGGTSTYTVGGAPGNIGGQSITGSAVADEITPTSPTPGFRTTVNDDTVNGGGGDDMIDGGLGNDNLTGGDGFDTIYGDSGTDILTGGTGGDRFRFRSPSEGIDTITDYTVGPDVIQVSASGFGSGLAANNVFATPAAFGVALPVGINGQYAAFFGGVAGLGAQDLPGTYGVVNTNGTFAYSFLGGGLYYDADGVGTGSLFVQFAQLTAPALAVGPTLNVAGFA